MQAPNGGAGGDSAKTLEGHAGVVVKPVITDVQEAELDLVAACLAVGFDHHRQGERGAVRREIPVLRPVSGSCIRALENADAATACHAGCGTFNEGIVASVRTTDVVPRSKVSRVLAGRVEMQEHGLRRA